MDILWGIVALLVVAAIVYFIPSIVALVRGRQDHAYIFALNMFLGWTFIGWVVALLWAMRHDKTPLIKDKEKKVYEIND
jgi:hypothetical protein